MFLCCSTSQVNPAVAEEKADTFFPSPGYFLRDSAAVYNCSTFQLQDLGWTSMLLLGSCLAGGKGEENQAQPGSKWCMWTSFMLVFVCCVRQTRARGSGLLPLWQGARRLHGAMLRSWWPYSMQWLELHVLMRLEATFKDPEMQNIIQRTTVKMRHKEERSYCLLENSFCSSVISSSFTFHLHF